MTIKHRPSPLAMLPFVAYHYHLGENLLSYDADSEKDLGVHINKSFTFNEQCEILLTKANQKFCILTLTQHFQFRLLKFPLRTPKFLLFF